MGVSTDATQLGPIRTETFYKDDELVQIVWERPSQEFYSIDSLYGTWLVSRRNGVNLMPKDVELLEIKDLDICERTYFVEKANRTFSKMTEEYNASIENAVLTLTPVNESLPILYYRMEYLEKRCSAEQINYCVIRSLEDPIGDAKERVLTLERVVATDFTIQCILHTDCYATGWYTDLNKQDNYLFLDVTDDDSDKKVMDNESVIEGQMGIDKDWRNPVRTKYFLYNHFILRETPSDKDLYELYFLSFSDLGRRRVGEQMMYYAQSLVLTYAYGSQIIYYNNDLYNSYI